MFFCFLFHLLDLEGLDSSGEVVETLDADDRVGQTGLAQELFTPRAKVALRGCFFQILRDELERSGGGEGGGGRGEGRGERRKRGGGGLEHVSNYCKPRQQSL